MSNSTIDLWDITGHHLGAHTSDRSSHINKAVFNKDGNNILVTYGSNIALLNVKDCSVAFKTRDEGKKINFAYFTDDEREILSIEDSSSNYEINTYDIKSNKRLTHLVLKSDFVKKKIKLPQAFSPNKKIMAVLLIEAGSDTYLTLMDTKKGNALANMTWKIRDYNSISALSFSPDGDKLITSFDGISKLWHINAPTSQKQKSNEISTVSALDLKGPMSIPWSAVYSPDGNCIATVFFDSSYSVRIWNATTGNLDLILKGHTNIVSSIAYSPNGKNIASSSFDGTFKIWDAHNGKLLDNLDAGKSKGVKVIFSPDGDKLLTISQNKTAIVWDVSSGKAIAYLKGHTADILSASFSPDGKTILTGADDYDNTAKLWDAGTGKMLADLKKHNWEVYFSAFTKDGRKVITSSQDHSIAIWDAKTGKRTQYFPGTSEVVSNDVSQDGAYVVICPHHESEPYLFDVNTGKKHVDLNGHKGEIRFATFNKDGKTVLTTSDDHTAKLWDVKSGILLADFIGHTSSVLAATFSPDNTRILTTSLDNTIKVWDAGTGKEIYTFFSLDSSDYFVKIASGYYRCTPDAARMLHYISKDLKVITFEQLDIRSNRPDKVLAALGCRDMVLRKSYYNAYGKRVKKLGIDTAFFKRDFKVPEADIMNNFEHKAKKEQYTIKVAAKSEDPLDRFNVYVNGSPVYGLKGINIKNRKTLDTSIKIYLSQGRNIVEASVINVGGIENYRKPLTVNYEPEQPIREKVYFIGIGINHFAENGYDLQYCVNDIRKLREALTIKYGAKLVIDTFFDKKVNTSDIAALKQKLLNTSVNDKVIIAYSGHGMLTPNFDYYLSTYNMSFSQPEQGGMPYDILEGLLDSIPARKKLLLIDACHSGEIDKDQANTGTRKSTSDKKGLTIGTNNTRQTYEKSSFELMQELFVNVNKNTGATVISAARGTQLAAEKGALKNGVFTYCILEFMKDHEHATVNELKKYVNNKVAELTDGEQTPTARQENLRCDWEMW